MKLGFVSAIFPELSLEEVLKFAADEGFGCVELMCWPPGTAERRYAGVTHIDVDSLTEEKVAEIRDLINKYGVSISALGYYPNPLHPDADHRRRVIDHLNKVIRAAPRLGVEVVTTFIGRNATQSVPDNWPLLEVIWPSIVALAEQERVTLAIENCPMLFSHDEWPGGHNLAMSPAVWRRLFESVPSKHLGLNFDPSHLVWLHIDYLRAIREFGSRIVHFHAKDARIDADALYAEGVMGLKWHTPKIPGLGDVNWGQVFSILGDVGYRGPVCIEVEDRAFEDTLADRRRSLRQSKRYLEQYL